MGPVFALTLPESTNANNIETDLNANFTNLRAAMFLVDEKTWFVYLCQVNPFSSTKKTLKWLSLFHFCQIIFHFCRQLLYSDGMQRQPIALIVVATSNEMQQVDNASAMVKH